MGKKLLTINNVKKTFYYLKKNGVKKAFFASLERLAGRSVQPSYRYELPLEEKLRNQRINSESLENPYRFSILVPAFQTNAEFLSSMVQSVLAQSYPYWELIVADASSTDCVSEVMALYADERIHFIKLKENQGISRNTNEALKAAQGHYIGLLDHDDLLTPDALYEISKKIRKAEQGGQTPGLIYSDEDKMSGDGSLFYEPNFKPAFDLELFLSNNYICHFAVMERSLMQELGFRGAYDGAQDYDLFLRAAAKLEFSKERILHVGKVLYHWRCHEGSTAQNPASKFYAYEAGREALSDFLKKQGWSAVVFHSEHLGFYRISYLPDLFTVRGEIGAVGGKLLDHRGKISGGLMDRTGKVKFLGLPGQFSGYMHRASLMQEAEAVDIRCIQVREELQELFEACTGYPYAEEEGLARVGSVIGSENAALAGTTEGEPYREAGIRFCREARKAGYKICWQPELVRRHENSKLTWKDENQYESNGGDP